MAAKKTKTPTLSNEAIINQLNSHNLKLDLILSYITGKPVNVMVASALTQLTPAYIHKLVHLKKIPYIKEGQALLFNPAELLNWNLQRKQKRVAKIFGK